MTLDYRGSDNFQELKTSVLRRVLHVLTLRCDLLDCGCWLVTCSSDTPGAKLQTGLLEKLVKMRAGQLQIYDRPTTLRLLLTPYSRV